MKKPVKLVKMKRQCVVIPGFNEAKYLARVLAQANENSPLVVFVDDGSEDNSVKIADAHTEHVLHHETNLGKGAAMMTGAQYAFEHLNADLIVFMDADDQHDASSLPQFFKALEKFDIVFGVRNMGADMPLSRFLGNKLASVILNILYGVYIADIPSGYKGMTKQGFKKIQWKSSGYEVETEIALLVARQKIPFGLVEIKAIYHDTDKGMTLLDALHITLCLVQWRLGL